MNITQCTRTSFDRTCGPIDDVLVTCGKIRGTIISLYIQPFLKAALNLGIFPAPMTVHLVCLSFNFVMVYLTVLKELMNKTVEMVNNAYFYILHPLISLFYSLHNTWANSSGG